MEPVQTPSPEHTQFDQLVEDVDEFDRLPSHLVPLESDPPDGENSELGGMLLNDALALMTARKHGLVLLTAKIVDFDLLSQLRTDAQVIYYRPN